MKSDYQALIHSILSGTCPNATQLYKTKYSQVYLINQDPKLIVKFDKGDKVF